MSLMWLCKKQTARESSRTDRQSSKQTGFSALHWCCCDSPAALLLSSVVQVEEVCDHGRVVPQVLYCKLRRMALTVEQMLYGVWCHSTLWIDHWTDIWYAAGNAGLVTVQKPAVTRTQLGESGMDWPRQQISGGEAPRTLFGTKFVFAATTVHVWW